MSATFNWQVTSMTSYPEYAGETDVVFNVNWECIATETSGGVLYGSTKVGNTSVTYHAGSPYTPYNQLTNDQVIGWVKAELDAPVPSGPNGETTPGHGVADVEAALQQAIDNQINPPYVNLPLPWAPPAA